MAVIIAAIIIIASFLIGASHIVFSPEYIEVVKQGIDFLLTAIFHALDSVIVFFIRIIQ